ncbi:MAG TPA: PrsW family glutamic-type intramembrane protease [Vicinamibacterales bacterium]|jgi:RsiW-degrading membrane proteinase PrsW (M82 family)|nr:PrsW family glutamic-type intramembrane protease [Vicinamibacterales bacterium]
MLAHTAVALLPVLLFLLALVLMDSFKLARPLDIALAIACGAASAFLCDLVHTQVFAAVPTDVLVRYIAPVTEESAKAVFIAYLILRRRIGFLIDAAQVGFAAGAGFALIENIQYLRDLRGAGLELWIIRGLGTALLHGGTTAIFALLSKAAADREPAGNAAIFLPGLGAAIAIHSAFNHLPLPPLAMTALLMLVLPLLILAVFSRNERATRDWVVAGLDLDIDLLALVTSEHFATTRLGAYLRELRARFPGPVVADMFCLLRVELELSIQAKALLIAREAGLAAPVHEDAYRGLEELHYLRGSIGPTGLLALRPLNVTTHRDEWHRYLLKSRPRAARTRSL